MMRVAIALLLMFASPPAHAEARFALLIGNQAYDASVGMLRNPYNDIALVGDALAKQGFELLPPVKDARRSAILGAVRELVRRLNGGGSGSIGFLYYSGHGAAEKDTNINYLIPVDAKEPGTTAFWDESVKLDDMLRLLDMARSAAKFVVFDACRNELQLPTKDTSKGLVPVAEQQGMFIAYASAPGRTASDRGEKSGPYAAALAMELTRPGLDHLNLFQNVKEDVLASTGGAQQPWESNGLGRRVYLTGTTVPVIDAPSTRTSEAERAWRWVKDTESQSVLENFIKEFGNTPFGVLASARLEELRRRQVIAPTPAPPKVSSVGPKNPSFEELAATISGSRKLLGLSLSMLTEQLRAKHNIGKQTNGAIVLQVDQATPAAERGVKVGDVIVEVAQDAVTSLDDIAKSVDKVKRAGRKAVLLRLERKDGLRFVALPVQ